MANTENEFDLEYMTILKNISSKGCSLDLGIYSYNFCINTSNKELQPSGVNLSRFKNIELEMTTLVPDSDPIAEQLRYVTKMSIIGVIN